MVVGRWSFPIREANFSGVKLAVKPREGTGCQDPQKFDGSIRGPFTWNDGLFDSFILLFDSGAVSEVLQQTLEEIQWETGRRWECFNLKNYLNKKKIFWWYKMGYRDTLMITYLNHPIPWGGSQHEVYSSEPHKLKAMMWSLWESRATDDVIFTIHLLLVRWGYIESHLYLKLTVGWLIDVGD